jgi:hypothetical protein
MARQDFELYYANASYFKLRTFTLGYNFSKIASSIKMESLRIYVSGQNLFALNQAEFTAKDPESEFLVSWPVPTSYTIGLNANF